MKNPTILFFSAIALFSGVVTPAQAGRRNLTAAPIPTVAAVTAAPIPTVPVVATTPARRTKFDATPLSEISSTGIPLNPVSKEKMVVTQRGISPPPVAQAPDPGTPRRIKDGNPVVILLVPKPIVSPS